MFSPRTRTIFFSGCLFAIWAAVVLLTSASHEFWRDEVRALSIAMDSSSPVDLWRSLQDEGHPMLWYLLLYGGYQLASSKFVLPALSFLIAGAAVALFIVASPFPPWLKALFVLGGLPLYEYSVMARNYGISMLLFFAYAWMYPSRQTAPLAMGLILALLCNTNIHSLLLAGLLLSLWLWDTFVRDTSALLSAETCKVYAAMAVAIAGGAAALYTLWPSGDVIVSDNARYTAAHMRQAFLSAVMHPSKEFSGLFSEFVSPALASGVVLGSMAGLVARPPVFAVAYAGLCVLSVFFSVFYPGWYRHQGLFVVFLLCLYWIVLDERRTIESGNLRAIFRAGLYGGMPLLLLFLVLTGAQKIYLDWGYQQSASRAFQGFLKDHPEYTDAILIGEPDYFLEAVRYYADNRVYIARERRFGHTVRFVRSAQWRLSLGELLCVAWRIRRQENTPVLIVLGHPSVDHSPRESEAPSASIRYSYRRIFTWSAEELASWRRYTTLERQLGDNVIGDETYAVYSVTAPSNGSEPACSSAP